MEIKICHACKGTGILTRDIGTHNFEYEDYCCSNCRGTGRIKTRSYSYQVPYDMDDTEIFEIDSEIMSLIRKLESRCR